MRFTVSLGLILVTAACSTELTPAGQQVRQVSIITAENCQFLGAVSRAELLGLTPAQGAGSALNKVRNDVAAKGGNAFVLTTSTTTDDGSFAQADAYLCP